MKSLLKKLFFRKKEEYDHRFPNGMKVGNAQFIGEKEYQNDYFTTVERNGALFSAIAYAVTEKRGGKTFAVIVINAIKDNFLKGHYEKSGFKKFLSDSLNSAEKLLKDNSQGNKSGARLIAVVVDKGILHFGSIGDCSLFLLRNGEMIYLNDTESQDIQIRKITLKKGDKLALCSKGASKSLTEREWIWHLSGENHPYSKCQNLLEIIRRKNLGDQACATIIILEEAV